MITGRIYPIKRGHITNKIPKMISRMPLTIKIDLILCTSGISSATAFPLVNIREKPQNNISIPKYIRSITALSKGL